MTHHSHGYVVYDSLPIHLLFSPYSCPTFPPIVLFVLICFPLFVHLCPALNQPVYIDLGSHLYSPDLITQDSPFLAALQCHDFTLLAMFFGPLLSSLRTKFMHYSSHSAENTKNII